jgi:hypothetical protein
MQIRNVEAPTSNSLPTTILASEISALRKSWAEGGAQRHNDIFGTFAERRVSGWKLFLCGPHIRVSMRLLAVLTCQQFLLRQCLKLATLASIHILQIHYLFYHSAVKEALL